MGATKHKATKFSYLCGMIAIDDTLISDDLIEQYFCCDLSQCKGACCIEGDAGAPMNQEEIDYLEEHTEAILPYLTKKGKKAIQEKGVFEMDEDGDYVTPLIDNAACAYYYEEDGILFCGIEKAMREGKATLRKPCSCYLYPVRLQQYEQYTAVNYHEWPICDAARIKGRKENIRVYEFLKGPLTDYFGEEWYAALEAYAKEKLGK